MDASILLLVAVAAAALAGLLAAIGTALILRRSGGEEAARLQSQMTSALDSLRSEVRTSLDGATQTLNQRLAQSSSEIDRRLAEIGDGVGKRLDSTSGLIGARLDGAARAVAEVHQRLGTVQGAAERVLEVGLEIAELQRILKAPKLRGGLGEAFLGELLAQVLPPTAFELQKTFRGGERVDAVVKLGGRLVPVDSKFPLENFTRMVAADGDQERIQARRAFVNDVKRRIDEIAVRYIQPDEGTFDFALMYVPAENVYYETIVRDLETDGGLYEYSLARRVIPVSPNTFYSYLQVIVFGLRGLAIDGRAREVLDGLDGLAVELDKFHQEYQILGKHLEDALRKYAEGVRRLQRFGDALERLEALGDEAASPPSDDAAADRGAGNLAR